MATEEYLNRFIEAGKRYEELPIRLQSSTTELEFSRRAIAYSIKQGLSWSRSMAFNICGEHDYYNDLIKSFRASRRLYPYHLAEYICRVARISPHRYYLNMIADAMKDDRPYDSIPNFTAADIVKVVGISRNEYIATVVQAKSKRLLWRINRAAVKDLLPQEPRHPEPQPWWRACVVNLGEMEYRQLTVNEARVCNASAKPGGALISDLQAHGVLNEVVKLYKRGLVYLVVPVDSEDHISVPPLEGFVSNTTSVGEQGSSGDPLESLLYQVFVAASDNVTVADLAGILNVDIVTLQMAISMACRLGFCKKLISGGSGNVETSSGMVHQGGGRRSFSVDVDDATTTTTYAALLSEGQPLDLDAALRVGSTREDQSMINSSGDANSPTVPSPGGGGGQKSIALVVDSEITGFLMMGALTPNCKKHSVTLFEGGRVYGKKVMEELISELTASVKMASDFEGEMKALVNYAKSLVLALECMRENCPGMPLELLRKESVENLPPAAAYRIITASYSAVVPVTSLAFPPLPLPPNLAHSSSSSSNGPVNWGPVSSLACMPWLQLALYQASHSGPQSLVLAAGQQFKRLPSILLLNHNSDDDNDDDGGNNNNKSNRCCTHAYIWPWDCQAVKEKMCAPLLVESRFLLYTLNEMLTRTGVLIQPLYIGNSNSKGKSSVLLEPEMIDVPLPLTTRLLNASSSSQSTTIILEAFTPTGEAMHIDAIRDVPPGLWSAVQGTLGMGGGLGSLRFIHTKHIRYDNSSSSNRECSYKWVPLQLTVGMPLQPPQLCEAACKAASERGMFQASAEQRQGQARLQSLLTTLVSKYSKPGGGNGGVPQPAGNIELNVSSSGVGGGGEGIDAPYGGDGSGLEVKIKGGPAAADQEIGQLLLLNVH